MGKDFWSRYFQSSINGVSNFNEFCDLIKLIICFLYLFPDQKKWLLLSKNRFLQSIIADPKFSTFNHKLNWLKNTLKFKLKSRLAKNLFEENLWWKRIQEFYEYSDSADLEELSSLFEKLRSPEEKRKTGIFYTPKLQVDLICKYSLFYYLKMNSVLIIEDNDLFNIVFLNSYSQNIPEIELNVLNNILMDSKILDPACGIGIFLDTMVRQIITIILKNPLNLHLKNYEVLNIVETVLLNQFGFDIDPSGITMTKISLCKIWLDFQSNFLTFEELIDKIPYSSLKIYEHNFLTESLTDGIFFDIIIGNPPFLRHHTIPKTDFSISSFMKSVDKAFPDFTLKIDKKSDVYIYFWLKSIMKTKIHGVVMFLVSRSWLSSQFSFSVKQLFTNSFQLDMIIELPAESWKNVEIRTHLVIGHKIKSNNEKRETIFFVWKNAITEIFKLSRDEIFNNFVKKSIIEVKDQLIEISTIKKPNYQIIRISDIRPFLVEDKSTFPFSRLDYFLMDPLLIHDILIPYRAKFCKLSDLGTLTMGSTTGANKFFYLSQTVIEEKKLPSINVHKMSKSPREWKSVMKPQDDRLLYLLHIPETLDEDSEGCLKYYINEIKQEILERPFFKNKKQNNWYKVPLIKPDILIPNMIYKRSFVAFNNKKYHIDKQWIGFTLFKEKNFNFILLAFMNSLLGTLLREIQGTRSLGLGSLKLSLTECKNLIVIDPEKIPSAIKNKLDTIISELGELEIPFLGEESEYFNIQKMIDKIVLCEYLNIPEKKIDELAIILNSTIKWRFPDL